MYSKEMIELIVYDAVKAVTGIQEVFEHTNLLDRHVCIFPADFLYIFDLIERKIEKSLSGILTDNSDDIFVVKYFVDEIYKIYIEDAIKTNNSAIVAHNNESMKEVRFNEKAE